MLKKIFRIILLPALVFAIAVTVISCGKEEKMRQKADNIPQISDREGLEKALQGSPQMHASRCRLQVSRLKTGLGF